MKKLRKLKKGLAILLSLAMVVGLIPGMCTIKVSAATGIEYSKPTGDGTEVSPYEISTAAELYWFAALVNGDTTVSGVEAANTAACAKLTTNVTVNMGVLKEDGDIADSTGNFMVWTPIGNSSNQYTGTFDGQGYTISGLYYYNTNYGSNDVGLFGYVGSGGNVSKVGVVDSSFYGWQSVGNVCGVNYGEITNCYGAGRIRGTTICGGICGTNGGEIQACYYKGSTVNSNTIAGGICGRNDSGTIKNCYSIGGVTVNNNYVGGICGANDNNGTITNCYYLDGTANGGIRDADVTGSAEKKTLEQFHSGAVCFLLINSSTSEDELAWGQDLSDTESYPVLGGKMVGCDENGNYFNTTCKVHRWVFIKTVPPTCVM